MNHKFTGLFLIIAIAFGGSKLSGQTVELANDFYRYGLTEDAKRTCVLLLNDGKSSDVIKAHCLYLLGQICFEEGKSFLALETWRALQSRYPDSPETKQIGDRIKTLRDSRSKTENPALTSAVASFYIENGDYWAEPEGENFSRLFAIDGSYLDKPELALKWYDRVIDEFKGTSAAELAYSRKLFLYFHLIQSSDKLFSPRWTSSVTTQLPKILEVFATFEKDFPDSRYLQGFRYQIGQTYWYKKDTDEAKKWFQKVIDGGKGESTFYTELAEARLKKLEF